MKVVIMIALFEKYRILVSRVSAIIALFFICTTESYWEIANDQVSFSLFCAGMIFVGFASLGRVWCLLYITGHKNKTLITEGPYSICRNPLYFCNMIGVIGIGCCSETFTFPVVFMAIFAFYYPFVIVNEERRLAGKFGKEYTEYQQRVPAFFPKFPKLTEPETYIVNPKAYRRYIFSALWIIWMVGFIEFFEGMREIGLSKHFWTFY